MGIWRFLHHPSCSGLTIVHSSAMESPYCEEERSVEEERVQWQDFDTKCLALHRHV